VRSSPQVVAEAKPESRFEMAVFGACRIALETADHFAVAQVIELIVVADHSRTLDAAVVAVGPGLGAGAAIPAAAEVAAVGNQAMLDPAQ
jgi:hypothetical protein